MSPPYPCSMLKQIGEPSCNASPAWTTQARPRRTAFCRLPTCPARHAPPPQTAPVRSPQRPSTRGAHSPPPGHTRIVPVPHGAVHGPIDLLNGVRVVRVREFVGVDIQRRRVAGAVGRVLPRELPPLHHRIRDQLQHRLRGEDIALQTAERGARGPGGRSPRAARGRPLRRWRGGGTPLPPSLLRAPR